MNWIHRHRRELVWLLLGMAAAFVVVVLIKGASKTDDIRTTQLEGTPLGKKLMASADQIKSCTTPGGKCYQRGQRQQGAAIGAVNAGSRANAAAAAACAARSDVHGYKAILHCMDAALAASPPRR